LKETAFFSLTIPFHHQPPALLRISWIALLLEKVILRFSPLLKFIRGPFFDYSPKSSHCALLPVCLLLPMFLFLFSLGTPPLTEYDNNPGHYGLLFWLLSPNAPLQQQPGENICRNGLLIRFYFYFTFFSLPPGIA